MGKIEWPDRPKRYGTPASLRNLTIRRATEIFMTSLFLPDLGYKALDRIEIAIADVIDERIPSARFDASMGREIILRNVGPKRVSPSLDKFLVSDLAFPREEPIDKDLRGIGVRRSIDQSDVAAARPDQASLLEFVGFESVYWQALLFRIPKPDSIRVLQSRHGILALRYPVQKLPNIPAYAEIHFGEKSSQKLRAQLLAVIHENQGLLRSTGHWLGNDNLSLPLGIEKTPVGFELLRVYQSGVIMEIIKRRAGKREDVFIFVIAVDMLSLPPLRLV